VIDCYAGNLTCRAPSSATTCAGTPTGAQLSYDNEGRLTAWQNAPSSPTSTDSFLYDGAGNRVEQVVTSAGTSTTTLYVGDLEQLVTNGASTTSTTYYYAGSRLVAEAVNGAISYLPSDGLGSVTVALSSTGTVQAAQLYSPYGAVRCSSGTMPTDYGYTGQRSDAATGLDYYGARYYDPAAAQFGSADTVADGLNRYGYVGGNPTTATDPSGHSQYLGGDDGGSVATPPGDDGGERGCADRCHHGDGGDGGGGVCGGTRQCDPTVGGTSGGTPDGCGPACQGRNAKNRDIGGLQNLVNGLKVLVSFMTLFGDLVQWGVDALKPAGLERTLDRISDFISIVGDLLSLGTGVVTFIGSFTGWNMSGVMQWIHGATAVINTVAAAFKLFRSLGGIGLRIAKIAVMAIYNTVRLIAEGADWPAAFFMAASIAVIQRIRPDMRIDAKLLAQGFGQVILAAANGFQAMIDHDNSIPDSDYCQVQYGRSSC
jgi:RHS repeat-associated protein